MRQRILSLTILLVLISSSLTSKIWAQKDSNDEVITLSDSIGEEIDKKEQESYHLFPDIKGFKSAKIVRLSNSKYRLDYTYEDATGVHNKSRKISSDAVELTKIHLKLSEDYWRIKDSVSKEVDQNSEAEILYKLSLKYASQARYDLSSTLIEDLVLEYPESPPAIAAQEFQKETHRLWKTKKALFQKSSLIDQSGRTDLLIFSGYYGLWLGLATPLALGAESEEAFGAGLLVGGPLSLLLGRSLTKEANISDGRATMIILGAHLGTWQGIGWAAQSDAEAKDVIGIGELTGLTGIIAATLLTSQIDFSTGHSGLTSSGLQWGAWFGLVLGIMADAEDVLPYMLIGSDVLILGTGIAAKDVRMSKGRVRLINLGGVIGTVVGFGIDLLANVDEASTALAIAGVGSVVGLAAGASLTRNYDKGEELSFYEKGNSLMSHSSKSGDETWSVSPELALKKSSYKNNELVPYLLFRLNF